MPTPEPNYVGSHWRRVSGLTDAFATVTDTGRSSSIGWAISAPEWSLDRPLPIATGRPRPDENIIPDIVHGFTRSAEANVIVSNFSFSD